jgi:hypothetical protein
LAKKDCKIKVRIEGWWAREEGKPNIFDHRPQRFLPRKMAFSAFTMSPIFVANPLSPMPAASYI